MLYEKYRKKMQKLSAFLYFLKRRRILIISIVCVLFALLSATLSFKGVVYTYGDIALQIEYGQEIEHNANAFLSEVEYEYRMVGSENWSREIPKSIGLFQVRAVSKRLFGFNSYGKIQTFEIIAKPIDVYVIGEAVQYGDNPRVSAQLSYGDKIVCDQFEYEDISQTTARAIPLKNSIIITNEAGIDVTSFYKINVLSGDITFSKRSIEITTKDAQKVYDGIPLTMADYHISSGALVNNDMIVADFIGSQTDVGVSKNIASFKVFTDEGLDITKHYNIDCIFGELKITPLLIEVTTKSGCLIYDGTPLFFGDFDITSQTKLIDGHKAFARKGTLTKAINIGNHQNIFELIIEDSSGVDISKNYEIEYIYGTLTIEKREIIIETSDGDLIYSGEEQGYFHYTIKEETSIIEGQTISLMDNSLTTIKDVEYLEDGTYKEYPNRFEIEIFSDNENVSENYSIIYTYGKIKMLPCPVAIKTASKDFIYNGSEQYDTTFSLISDISFNHTAIAIDNKKTTLIEVERNPDSSIKAYPNVFEVKIVFNNEDISQNYSISYEYGTLRMLPRPISIRSDSREWEYDGLEHSNNEYLITSGTLVENDYIIADSITSALNVVKDKDKIIGISNIIDINIFNSLGILNNYNYDIRYDYGQLTITPRKITVTTATSVFDYDGENHFDSSHTSDRLLPIHSTFLKEGTLTLINDVIRKSDNSIISKENKFEIEVFFNEENITYNYSITYDYGSLTVLPREITITTQTSSWKYDGEKHSDSRHTITEGLLVDGHKTISSTYLTVVNVKRISGNQVGDYENKMTIDIFSDTKKVNHNYNIAYIFGTLTINPRVTTARLYDASYAYTGSSFSSNHWYISEGDSIVEGQYSVCSAIGSQTEIGTSVNKFSSLTIYWAGENVTYNYDLTLIDGMLTVYARHLYLYANNASKIYNGQPLTSRGYTIGGEGLLLGHILSAEVDGSQLEVGIGYNIIIQDSVKITDLLGVDVSHFYNIHLSAGKLQVGLREVTLSTVSATKEYDGTRLTDFRYELSGNLLEGATYNVYMNSWIIMPGKCTNDATIYFYDKDGNDVTYCYIVNKKLGILTITGNLGGGLGGELGSGEGQGQDGGEASTIFNATSSASATVYFRMKSFGEYEMNGWLDAPSYESTDINPLYFTASSLIASGKTSASIQIEPIMQYLSYMLPYYATDGYLTQDDTVITAYYNNAYSINYIKYDYNYTDSLAVIEQLSEYEKQYYNYVLNTYLTLPSSTRAKLLEIASSNNLKADSPTIIKDVATYVQNLVEYSLKHEAYYGDYALYFFTQAKTGLCRHYATGATAMFRALGIPARYTVGYVGNMSAGKSVKVTSSQAHAWVEVYIKGTGWVLVEVTGSGEGSSIGENVSGIGGEDDIINMPKELRIKPIDVRKQYDSTPLYAVNQIEGDNLDSILMLENLLDSGHYFDVVVEGERTEYGVSLSRITKFVIYSKHNVNVTEEFKVIYASGRICITRPPIIINVFSISKSYDGTPLSYNSDDYWADLPYGFKLDLKLEGSLTDAGVLKLSLLEELPYRIYDSLNNDVSEQYSLVFEGEPLTIYRRSIEISSGSAQKTYDGKPLTNSSSWLSKGFFPTGHRYEAVISGTIIDIGNIKNQIESIIILDESEKNVTNNYLISVSLGILTIT